MADTPQQVAVASDPWTAGLTLATEVLKFVGEEIAKVDINKAKNLVLALQEELRKPREEQDDAKVLALRQEIPVIQVAALNQLKIYQAKQK